MPRQKAHACPVCGKTKPAADVVRVGIVRPAVAALIGRSYPAITEDDYICLDDLNRFRHEYIESLLEMEKGELTELEDEVVDSLATHEIIASNVETEFETALTFGQRLSDHMADFGGSWRFIILFGGVLTVWILVNAFVLIRHPFDPYPFILLNLVLSCLAALQAPIIMMSQNRQEARDRLRSQNDYQVNLKAELEIRHLHQKMDHLLSNQWDRLVEIQQIQMELMNDMRGRSRA